MAVPGLVLLATAAGGIFLDRVFDHFTGFAGEFLNSANQFFLLTFAVTEIIIGELRPFLFQFTLGDIPVAFDFERVHLCVFLVGRQCDKNV